MGEKECVITKDLGGACVANMEGSNCVLNGFDWFGYELDYRTEIKGIYISFNCSQFVGLRLFKKCQLQYLEINLLTSKKQVEGLCKLLEQKKETLASLEFVGCKLPAHLVTEICESLHVKGFETNVIKTFSITRSKFLDSSYFPFPFGLESLLTAARGNHLHQCDADCLKYAMSFR
ncbi:Leucine-rich repeat, ribonuclease inhibitor subtype [Artemisia annua]|uniref:Leucine-rich repeat, ribonuclease inhibitor subtype n=1 Tax=Artemisia annua TaxID=35608 RepID=A0A2U1LTZ1_ARTAN|nr:Leucine-rich repeat, ribonuclease inhibitor subtype [Artemisia annua]